MGAPRKTFLVCAVIVVIGIAVYCVQFSRTQPRKKIAPRQPNILLVTLDTTRVDHLSCYGYDRETTPNVDRVAEEGHKFLKAVSTSSWTLPAHASLLTGTYPSRHGARFAPAGAMANAPLHANRLDQHLPTLAEILGKNGYVTAGIGGGPWFHEKFGLGRGFSFYDDPASEDGPQWMARTAEQVSQIAISWLKKNYEHPFFILVNYFDPHTPYTAPEPFNKTFGTPKEVTDAFDVADKVMKAREKLTDMELQSLLLAYDNEIAYADYFLGRLLDEMKTLGVYDNSIIIITSDHGEYFGEHDLVTHTVMVYDEVVRVPLIIRFPQSMDEEMPEDVYTQLTDIMPTILDKLNIPIPVDVQGEVIGHLKHPIIAESFQHFGYSRVYGNRFDNDWRALYMGDVKYIWTLNGDPQLFDLSQDPHETTNIATRTPEQLEVAKDAMEEWLSSFPLYSFDLQGASGPNLKTEELERLKTLGYIQ